MAGLGTHSCGYTNGVNALTVICVPPAVDCAVRVPVGATGTPL